MAIDLPIVENRYLRSISGVYGEFGAGGGVQAFYLQCALTPAQLAWVSLISEITGSEKWDVRDLFQRDVDIDRVTNGLIPYLREEEKIKFFNPLTLTVLPMANDGHTVLPHMPEVQEKRVEVDGRMWNSLERPDYYRLRWIDDHPEFAVLDLSEAQSRLVAIDGQHRLSALKRILRDTGTPTYEDLMTWRIPIVVVSFRSTKDGQDSPSVLEVVRSIFVSINKEAKEINRAREILLSDESINSVFTQELLEKSHRNDLEPPEERDSNLLPLLCYDWRGEESGGDRVHAPAAIKSIEEIYSWFDQYILGEDFSTDQKAALGVDPTHPLQGVFYKHKLSHAASNEVRELSGEILKALSYVLQNFTPYKSYVSALRELEMKYVRDPGASDLAHHAFYQLRFGTNHADDAEKMQVLELVEQIRDDVDRAKRQYLPELISREIGMRGIMCSFGSFREFLQDMNWESYAEWFTSSLNDAYANGWMDIEDVGGYRSRVGSRRRNKYLRHVAENHEGTITNYRFDDLYGALGVYVELLVGEYGQPLPGVSDEAWIEQRSILVDTLRNTVFRGYKKEVRPDLKEQFPNGGKELTDAVNVLAGRLADEHIRRFEKELDRIQGG